MQIPLFKLEKLTVEKKSKKVLEIKKFEIHRGAVYCITGKIASGKTLLMDILSQRIKPTKGSMEFDGKLIRDVSKKDFNDQVAVIPQGFIVPRKSVRKFMTKFIGQYSHMKGRVEKKLSDIVKKMGIEDLMDLKMKELTPGQLRQVYLATQIAADTKVMFIDEIEQHLSGDDLNTLVRILYRKSNYDGVTIVITTLNPDKIKKLVSVFITMNNGRISSVRSQKKSTSTRKKASPSNKSPNESKNKQHKNTKQKS